MEKRKSAVSKPTDATENIGSPPLSDSAFSRVIFNFVQPESNDCASFCLMS